MAARQGAPLRGMRECCLGGRSPRVWAATATGGRSKSQGVSRSESSSQTDTASLGGQKSKTKLSARLVPSGGSEEKSVPCLLLASRGCQRPLVFLACCCVTVARVPSPRGRLSYPGQKVVPKCIRAGSSGPSPAHLLYAKSPPGPGENLAFPSALALPLSAASRPAARSGVTSRLCEPARAAPYWPQRPNCCYSANRAPRQRSHVLSSGPSHGTWWSAGRPRSFLSSVSVVYSYDKNDTRNASPLLDQFDYMGSDIKSVTQKVIQIIGFVNTYPEGSSLESYTVSIVQLLGLTLGLSFDSTDSCSCTGDVCTMSPEAVHSHGIKEFSTCSLDEFKYFASNPAFACLRYPFHLQNTLPLTPVYKTTGSVCGNGKLEGNEQCDCGTARTCTHKSCCDATSCRLKRKKQCGSGECCTKDCKLKPLGTLCRKSVDECDFTDYCNGLDSHCVPDTFVQDGHSCNSGEAHCYKGRCRTFDKQCRNLIGGASRGAPFACFEEMNSLGDRYGNCGRVYCGFPNILCGKLVCAWPHKALVSRANLSVVYTHIREEMCVSTYLNTDRILKETRTTYSTPEDRDKTFVEDGSTCGPGMICERFSCREIKYLIDYSLCESSRHCRLRGVCNNFNHCHCNKGFAPPNCTEQKGQFGSIDDGHRSESTRSLLDQRPTTSPKRRFQLIFYISLPVLLITAAVLTKRAKIRELCYRGETESERSVSEESSNLSPSVSHCTKKATTWTPNVARSFILHDRLLEEKAA
ncbi:disintegrin and metalloproteinase domain-containing protein 5-like [Pteronotus mesoamericanus]|uniref:disintegrin and metalloproteinase domain-containing protein 5-like n=1 Tax=Pteronotus mesoamericanus TaxID=1884717 RepID=UPI0023EB2EC7|nr:disintegrin and metalloproteinase domain-containing protein 5-like [Pteronotus parnellii mesoamericanus]